MKLKWELGDEAGDTYTWRAETPLGDVVVEQDRLCRDYRAPWIAFLPLPVDDMLIGLSATERGAKRMASNFIKRTGAAFREKTND